MLVWLLKIWFELVLSFSGLVVAMYISSVDLANEANVKCTLQNV